MHLHKMPRSAVPCHGMSGGITNGTVCHVQLQPATWDEGVLTLTLAAAASAAAVVHGCAAVHQQPVGRPQAGWQAGCSGPKDRRHYQANRKCRCVVQLWHNTACGLQQLEPLLLPRCWPQVPGDYCCCIGGLVGALASMLCNNNV